MEKLQMRLLFVMLVAISCLFIFAACSSDDDDTNADGDTESSTESDTEASDTEATEGTTEKSVVVKYAGNDTTVKLSEGTKTSDETAVVLKSIVEKAITDKDVTTLKYNFIASDGFYPAKGDNCKDYPTLEGTYLDKGSIELESGTLVWDDAASLPKCMKVKDLATIDVTD